VGLDSLVTRRLQYSGIQNISVFTFLANMIFERLHRPSSRVLCYAMLVHSAQSAAWGAVSASRWPRVAASGRHSVEFECHLAVIPKRRQSSEAGDFVSGLVEEDDRFHCGVSTGGHACIRVLSPLSTSDLGAQHTRRVSAFRYAALPRQSEASLKLTQLHDSTTPPPLPSLPPARAHQLLASI